MSGSSLQQAIQWISGQMKANPKADRIKLIDEASRMFNLGPLDGDFLFRTINVGETN